MRFEFASVGRIIFGAGAIKEAPGIAAENGKTVFLVTGKNAANHAFLVDSLNAKGLSCAIFEVPGEPTIQLIQEAVQLAHQARSDLVIGFGGGSAIDTAKAVSALLTNPGELKDYLEVFGAEKKLTQPPVPVIAIPTTAGTGAEVTRNAVIGSPEHRMKISMRSPFLLPRVALVDPELTISMPPAVTASTGMDALTQLIEPLVSARSNPMTDLLCYDGIRRAAQSLLNAYERPGDRLAREGMALASLYGGLALANAGLGVAHGIASPLGGMVPAAHGAICARLLGPVVAANVCALSAMDRNPEDLRSDRNLFLKKYQDIARILTGNDQAEIDDGIRWIDAICQRMSIPRLSDHGLTEQNLPELVEKASIASSTQANPVRLSQAELRSILEQAM